MFWLFPVARMLFLVTPLFYLLFGLKLFEATVEEFFAFAGFHVVCALMLGELPVRPSSLALLLGSL